MKKLLSVLLGFLIISSCKDKDKDTPPPPIAVANISLSPSSLTLKVDDTSTLKAVITPENAANKLIEWSSSNAAAATVSQDGEVKAVKEGEAIITAKSKANPDKTATCKVAVSPKVPMTRIVLDPATASVLLNETLQIVPALTPANTTESINWTSSDTKLATVSATGLVTALALGQATITASASYSNIKTTCQITITDKPVLVESIRFSSPLLTLKMGDNVALTPIISPTNATNRKVRFNSDRPNIVSVSDKGVITANAVGESVITVTTDDGNKTASCTVAVAPPVSAIALTPNPASVGVGSRVQLIAAVTPENAPNKTVTWSSSDVSKATVDKDGWVTGVALGQVTITATATDGSAVKGEVTLTVKNKDTTVSATAITLGPEKLSVPVPAEGMTTTLANAPHTISSNRTAVQVTIPAAAGSTIKIGTAAFTQGQSVDFTNPVTFTITAEGGTTVKNYSVSIPAYNAATNPYGIYTVNDLVDVQNELTATYLLKNDITLPDANAIGAALTGISDYVTAGWRPLGPFTGTFDGRNFKITNFYANRTAGKVGLFGELGSGGSIRNLTTNSSTERSTSGSQYTGILVGYSAGTIDKCYATGNVSSSSSYYYSAYAGGLVGYSISSISNSYATGNVSSSSSSSAYAGGLVGYSISSISNSYATGNVSSSNSSNSSAATYAGGLVGYSEWGTISNSYATGNTTSSSSSTSYTNYAGGLVGYNISSISNSHATGSVSSSSPSSSAGGLVGYNTRSISNSYATGSVSSPSRSSHAGGLVGYHNNHNNNNSNAISNSYATGSVSSSDHVGGLVGLMGSGSISNSYATGNATSSSYYAGGLVGLMGGGSISNSYATGSASSSYYAGGLVGFREGSTISNSYATGNATSTSSSSSSSYAGGLVGYSRGSATISNSYATGNVSSPSSSSSSSSSSYAGGLVGYSEWGTISNSYATGNVSSSSPSSSAYAGGLVGYNTNTNTISNSYATGSVSSYSSYSSSYAGGLVGSNSNGSYTNCYRNSNAIITKNNTTTTVTDDASIAGILAKTKAEMQAPAFVTSLNSGTSVWGRGVGKNDDLPFIRGVGIGK